MNYSNVTHKGQITMLEILCGLLPKPKKALSVEEMSKIIERKK